MAATSCGLKAGFACTTTVVACVLGHFNDPAIAIRCEAVVEWLKLWKAMPRIRLSATKAWMSLREKLIPKHRWLRVKGPIAGLQSLLRDVGWVPTLPTRWEDPEGQQWVLSDGPSGLGPIRKALAHGISKALWAKAASFHAGKGLEGGADLEGARKALQSFEKKGQTELHTNALLALSAGAWTRSRLFELGLCPSDLCPRCSQGPETLLHRYWQCPDNANVDSPAVRATDRHSRRAAMESGSYPCLWLRGINPWSWTHPLAEHGEPALLSWSIGRLPAPLDQGQLSVFTDGSGGPVGLSPASEGVVGPVCSLTAGPPRAAGSTLSMALCRSMSSRSQGPS